MQQITIEGNRSKFFNNLHMINSEKKRTSRKTYIIDSMYQKDTGYLLTSKTISNFMKENISQTMKEFHEILNSNAITRLFLDIEIVDTKFKTEECDMVMNYFLNKVKEYDDKKNSTIEGRYDYYTFNGSRVVVKDNKKMAKTSFHLIMPNILFKDISELSKFVDYIITNTKDGLVEGKVPINKYTDTQVYKGGRLFRIPFSRKGKEPNSELTLYDLESVHFDDKHNDLYDDDIFDKFDNAVYKEWFVQYHNKKYTIYTPTCVSEYKSVNSKVIAKTKSKNTKDNTTLLECHTVPKRVFDDKDINKISKCVIALPPKYHDDYDLWTKTLYGISEVRNYFKYKLNYSRSDKVKKVCESTIKLIEKIAIDFSKKSSKFKSEEDVIERMDTYKPGKCGVNYIYKQLYEQNIEAYKSIFKAAKPIKHTEEDGFVLEDLLDKYNEVTIDIYDIRILYKDMNKVIKKCGKKIYVKHKYSKNELFPYVYEEYSKKELLDVMDGYVSVSSNGEEGKKLKFSDILRSRNMKRYKGIYFDPTDSSDKKDYLNKYVTIPHKLLAVDKISINDDLITFNEFIETSICSKGYKKGYYERYTYLMDWLAFLVQKRQRTGIMLLLCGHKGSGKSLFCKLASNLVTRRYSAQLPSTDTMFGDFNGYRKEKLLVVIDEHKLNYKYSDRFKNIVSRNDEEELNIKYGSKRIHQVYDNYIGACNTIENVNLEFGDRRHSIFECGQKIDPSLGSKINRIICNQDLLSVFYSLLMNRDIREFKPDKIPDSDLRASSMIVKLNSFHTFILKNFKYISNNKFIEKKMLLAMYNSHLMVNSKVSNFKPCTIIALGKYMSSLEFEVNKKYKIDGVYKRCFTTPDDLKGRLSRLLNISNIQYYIDELADDEDISEENEEEKEEEETQQLHSDDKRNVIEKILNQKKEE